MATIKNDYELNSLIENRISDLAMVLSKKDASFDTFHLIVLADEV